MIPFVKVYNMVKNSYYPVPSMRFPLPAYPVLSKRILFMPGGLSLRLYKDGKNS